MFKINNIQQLGLITDLYIVLHPKIMKLEENLELFKEKIKTGDFLECKGLGNEIPTGFLIMNRKKSFWLGII